MRISILKQCVRIFLYVLFRIHLWNIFHRFCSVLSNCSNFDGNCKHRINYLCLRSNLSIFIHIYFLLGINKAQRIIHITMRYHWYTVYTALDFEEKYFIKYGRCYLRNVYFYFHCFLLAAYWSIQ